MSAPSTSSSVITTLKRERRWLLWLAEEVNGRLTKVPYTTTGRKASTTNPDDWCTYAQAKKAQLNFGSGIGIVFTEDQQLLGIDIDHVLTNNQQLDTANEHHQKVADLLALADTLCEISPSGTGLHLYFTLTAPLTPTANRHSPFELYTKGRFFTWTENHFGPRKDIRSITAEEAEALLTTTIGYPWGKAPLTASDTPLASSSSLEDAQLLSKMFAASNGDRIRALYDGDMSAHGDDPSRADCALLMHLAFWSNKDTAQMERLWLASPLGAREKTQKRADYRTRSINTALKNTTETYKDPATSGDVEIEFLFTPGAKGDKLYNKNTENVCRVLRHHPYFAGRFRFDEFKNRMEIKDGEKWRPLVDTDSIQAQIKISILYQFLRSVSKDMVYDAIIQVSKENAIDSAKSFMRSIKWDGEARLDTWLMNTYGTPDDEYHRAIGSNWMKGLVKRIMVPGCKFDYVLVLEGPQGVKKSTSLDVIGYINPGENWHVESTMSADNKDFFMQFEGKAIIEFSEGETLSRTEVKKMKSIITTASDRYRPSYGRIAEDFPRRCVFAMTTNLDEYLKDETGNRRWLPVKVLATQVNVEWLAANRDQLFAEAYVRVMDRNESTWEFPVDATRAAQDARRVSDPNEERVADWYYNFLSYQDRANGITAYQAFVGALNGVGSVMKKHEEMSITEIFKRSLRLESKRRMVNGVQAWRWYPAQSTLSLIQQEDIQESADNAL